MKKQNIWLSIILLSSLFYSGYSLADNQGEHDLAVCKRFTYTTVDAEGNPQVRMFLNSPEHLIDPESSFTSTVFKVEHVFNVEHEIKKQFPGLGACVAAVTQYEIISDEFIMDNNSKLVLGDKSLIVKSSKINIGVYAVLETTSKVKIFALEGKNKSPSAQLVTKKVSHWSELAMIDESDATPLLLNVLNKLALEMFKQATERSVWNAYQIFTAVRNTDEVFSKGIEANSIGFLFNLRPTPVFKYKILAERERYNKLKTAIYYKGLINTGFDYNGLPGDFLLKDKAEEVLTSCPNLDANSRTEVLNGPIVRKSAIRKYIHKCDLTQGLRMMIAEYAPAYDLARFNTLLGQTKEFLLRLERQKKELERIRRAAEKEDRSARRFIEEQEHLNAIYLKQTENAHEMVKRQEISKKALLDQLSARSAILELDSRYREILDRYPTQEAASNAMRDIGGMGSSVMGGAASGYSMNANPYAAVAGAIFGGMSFIGNRQYEEDQKRLTVLRRQADLEMRKVQAEQEHIGNAAAVQDLAHQIDQANIMEVVTRNQAEIAEIQLSDALNKIQFQRAELELIWDGVEGTEIYDQFINRLSDTMRRDIALYEKTFLHEYKIELTEGQRKIISESCDASKTRAGTANHFERCLLEIESMALQVARIRGEPKAFDGNILNPNYSFDWLMIDIDSVKNPVMYNTLVAGKTAGFTIGFTEEVNLTAVPQRHRVAEVVTADILYKLKEDSECENSHQKIRFKVSKDALDSFLDVETGRELLFNTVEYRESKEITGHEINANNIPKYNSENLKDLVDKLLGGIDKNNLVRRSPVGNWGIRVYNAELAKCIESLKYVMIYRYLGGSE